MKKPKHPKTRLLAPEDPRILRPDPVSPEWNPNLKHRNNTPIPTSAPHPASGQKREETKSDPTSSRPS